MTSTPMQAPDYGQQQGASLSDSMQAVYDSILKDEEARLSNATKQSQLPEALSKFSKTAFEVGAGLFTKKLQDTEAKALYDARMDGTITPEQIAEHDAAVNEINSQHRSVEKAANAIEKADQHDIVAERVRSTDPYYRYYYKLGQLRNQVRELPLLFEQLKETLTIPGPDGKPLTHAELTEYSDKAAWNAQAEVYMNRAFAGVSPALAAKEIFPSLDELFTRDSQKWAKANAEARKQRRVEIEQELIHDAVTDTEVNEEKIKVAFESTALTTAEKWEPILRLAKDAKLTQVQRDALGDTLITNRATGKKEPIREVFSRQFDQLEGLALTAENNKYQQENLRESFELKDVAVKNVAIIKGTDGEYTIAQIEAQEAELRGNPNADRALRYLKEQKKGAIDYIDSEEERQQVRRGMSMIEAGASLEDVEKVFSSVMVRSQLRNYWKNTGRGTSGGIRSRFNVQFESVKDTVEKSANVTDLSGADGSVALEVQYQQGLLADRLALIAGNPNLTDAQIAQEAIRGWREKWDNNVKTEGYLTEDGFPGAYNRVPIDAADMQAGKDRLDRVRAILKNNRTSVDDVFENYERLYTPEQFKSAIKAFRNGEEAGVITRIIAQDTNLTPLEVLEKLSPMFNLDLPPIPPEVRDVTDKLSAAQKAQLLRYPSPERLARYRGERTVVGDVNLDQLRKAIIGQESGGNPQAVHTSGPMPTGAAGLGQILPENIPSWSRQVLGREVSYAEFMANPDIQIQIINGKLTEMLNEQKAAGYTGSELIRRVASKWYSGRAEWLDSRRGQGPNRDEPSIYDYSMSILGRYQQSY